MPELPEVETMAQRLQDWVAGKKIAEYKVHRNPGGRYNPAGARGATIQDVYRRGKRLIFNLDNGFSILCHNAMSGFWDVSDEPWTFDYVEGKREAKGSDVRVEFELDSGRILRFHDARLFGSICTCLTDLLPEKFEKMGPEALKTPRMLPESPVFHILDSVVFLSAKKPIKQLLMEQERIAGLGNIYAAEVLWWAGVSPTRPGNSLNGDEHQAITEAIPEVLKAALARKLDYQPLVVYRKSKCQECGSPIKKEELAGRSTYYCPVCQR